MTRIFPLEPTLVNSYRLNRCCWGQWGGWWTLCTGRGDICGGRDPCMPCAPVQAQTGFLEFTSTLNCSYWKDMLGYVVLTMALHHKQRQSCKRSTLPHVLSQTAHFALTGRLPSSHWCGIAIYRNTIECKYTLKYTLVNIH